MASSDSARAFIGRNLRTLRSQRGMSQADLARVLGISRSAVSDVELGRASLSAEHLILVLKFFNTTADRFDPAPGDRVNALPKALAGLGASHLVEDPAILPSERLMQLVTAIRESLVEGENPRALTALAPVMVKNSGRINLPLLQAQFSEFGLKNRLGWLLENIAEAIGRVGKEPWPRQVSIDLARTELLIRGHLERFFNEDKAWPEDPLGWPPTTGKTRLTILQERSEISTRWNILTGIQVGDFADMLRSCLP